VWEALTFLKSCFCGLSDSSPPNGQWLLNNKEQANQEDYDRTDNRHVFTYFSFCALRAIVRHHITKQTVCQPNILIDPQFQIRLG
jgi:hypothetical protein